jgi:hypothetical protein
MGCPRWINCGCWMKVGSERFLPLVHPLLYLHSDQMEMNYLEQSEKRTKLNWKVWAMADTTTRSRTKYRRMAMAKEEEYRLYWWMNIQWCCGLSFSVALGLYILPRHPRYCVWLTFSQRSWLKVSVTQVLTFCPAPCCWWLILNQRLSVFRGVVSGTLIRFREGGYLIENQLPIDNFGIGT